MTRSILVPLDGSAFGESAIPYAIRMASDLETQIELLTVYDDEPTVAGWPLDPGPVRDAYREYHQDLIGKMENAGAKVVRSSVVGGEIGRSVVEYAQRAEPVMVVMATHGRGPISRSWFGSVADRMMRYASMPTILVRPEDDAKPWNGTDVAEPFRKLLVALDGSARAERSLEWVFMVGGGDAKYALVRAVPEPNLPSVYLPDAVKLRERALEQGTEEAREYLDGLRLRLEHEGHAICTEVFAGGSIATDILRFADRSEVDLIAVTTHGRSGLARLVMGSIADKIVRGAQQPVLVVRSV